MNNQMIFASTSCKKNYKKPINRINLKPECLDTHIISDDSESEKNIKNLNSKPLIVKSTCLREIVEQSKQIEYPNILAPISNDDDFRLNKINQFGVLDLKPSNNFLEVIEVDSSTDTNEPEILIVPPPVPLESILFKENSEKTSDFATSTPSSIKKLKAGPLPSPPPSPPLRPKLKSNRNFENYLANLEKLSSEDKVLNWNFSNEVDDVEDFIDFEKNGQMHKMKITRNSKNIHNSCNKILHLQSFNCNEINLTKVSASNQKKLQKSTTTRITKKATNKRNSGRKSKLINGEKCIEELIGKNANTFKIPNVPKRYLSCKPCENTFEGCGNSNCEYSVENPKEEFCKYLGLNSIYQNGDTYSSSADSTDFKKRLLRARQTKIATELTNIALDSESYSNEEKSILMCEVNPEKLKNLNTLLHSNSSSLRRNGEIIIAKPKANCPIMPILKPFKVEDNSVTEFTTSNVKPVTKSNEKSKIKIVCSVNSNLPQSGNSKMNTLLNQNDPFAPEKVASLVTFNPEIGKRSIIRENLSGNNSYTNDDNSSQKNLKNVTGGNKKESLIIIKNTYEKKPMNETNASLILSDRKLVEPVIHNEKHCTEKSTGKIKILDRVNYSPKTLKPSDNCYPEFCDSDRILNKNEVKVSSKLSSDSKDETKDKIKIEFSVNYANKESKEYQSEKKILDSPKNLPVKRKNSKSPKKQDEKSETLSINDGNSKRISPNKLKSDFETKTAKVTLKKLNEPFVISPIPPDFPESESKKKSQIVEPNKKKRSIIKNPSRLKFFRLVLKTPSQKISKSVGKKRKKLQEIPKETKLSLTELDYPIKTEPLNNNEILQENELLREPSSAVFTTPEQDSINIVTLSSNEIASQIPKLNLISNPLKFEDGDVLHAYYEKEILIVVQQNTVSFWKYSKILQMLGQEQEWQFLGEMKRNLNDEEIISPLKNRLLLHENIPVYVELRARQLPFSSRECNLLSPYICVYYFDFNKNLVQQHSVQLDSIKSLVSNVIYTTITYSRYFVLCWKQDTSNSTNRTGLCKYALTPELDTLASIREFKHLRHILCSLECINDDRLVGFGESQVTVWDHHTGDILSNLDLNIPIGRNLGSIMYSLESENYILLYQLIHGEEDVINDTEEILPQLKIIALNISNSSPAYRLIYSHKLPIHFENIKSSLNLNNYIIITALTGEELWVFVQQPQRLLFMNDEISTSVKRFYTTGSENYVEITGDNMNVKTVHENLMNFTINT